jgi:hypothetical protein
LVIALAGCAAAPDLTGDDLLNASPWARANQLPVAKEKTRWRHQGLGNRPVSIYAPTLHAGRPSLEARSERGDSLVRLPLVADGPQLGKLRFSWFVDSLNLQTDLSDRHLDDAVARVILQFDGDRSGFTARDHLMSDLLQALTGEPLPYATLIYVWDHRYPVGTVISHARSHRIKAMVVESGEKRLGQWVDFERDVSADFHQAFDKQTPTGLQGIALMTDSNNTQQPSKAWYGPLSLAKGQP